VSKITHLLNNYNRHIAIPWRDVAAAQRVIFCVYPESYERMFRAKLGDFEIATRNLNYGWVHFNLTNTFADWISSLKYGNRYYQKPQLMTTVIEKYEEYLEEEFKKLIEQEKVGNSDVVAISGVGSVFGFIKVSDLVDRFSPRVAGRLVVFFPGSIENNNYRLLDGYDGWNYHAVPISWDREL
jgi:hypothetical protein